MKALLATFLLSSSAMAFQPPFTCDGGNPVEVVVKVLTDSGNRLRFKITTTEKGWVPKIKEYVFPIEDVIKNSDGSKLYVNYKEKITLEVHKEEIVPGALYHNYAKFKGVGQRSQVFGCQKP